MKLNKIEIIISIFLLLITASLILIEISNNKIDQYNNDLFDNHMINIKDSLDLISNENRFSDYRLLNGLHIKIYVIENYSEVGYIENEFLDLAKNFSEGKISLEEYLFRKQNLVADKYMESINKVNYDRQIISELYYQKPVWYQIRDYSEIVAIILILITLELYIIELRNLKYIKT